MHGNAYVNAGNRERPQVGGTPLGSGGPSVSTVASTYRLCCAAMIPRTRSAVSDTVLSSSVGCHSPSPRSVRIQASAAAHGLEPGVWTSHCPAGPGAGRLAGRHCDRTEILSTPSSLQMVCALSRPPQRACAASPPYPTTRTPIAGLPFAQSYRCRSSTTAQDGGTHVVPAPVRPEVSGVCGTGPGNGTFPGAAPGHLDLGTAMTAV